uniref:N-acetyltransferase domain-containing protein n=1 Tax=Lotharella globosa TaxID=91324 RepID=A0A6U2WZ63_9EUKA|mmetsp:Transcript_11247/g.22105  ORF Transcript_11247/g.22105 Transcript_11247/m.22105 type:complete len:151 (+) Transcript_11247:120-572(+)
MALTSLRRIFADELPKFGIENLKTLTYSKECSTLLLRKNAEVLGGMVYRILPNAAAELCLCAIHKNHHCKGYGTFMMRAFQRHLFANNITSIVTAADQGAVGWFRKMDFRHESEENKWKGIIKEIKHGVFMMCKLQLVIGKNSTRPSRDF